MNVGELIVKLGFEANTTSLKDFVGMIGSLDMKTVMAGFGLDKLYDSLKNIIGGATTSAMSIDNFGQATGLSTEKLSKFKTAAEQFNVSGENLQNVLRNIYNQARALKYQGIGTGEGFARGGLDKLPEDLDSMKMLIQMLKFIKTQDVGARATWLEQFGGTDDLMRLIDNVDLFEKKMNEVLYTTNDQKKAILENNAAWSELSATWGQVGIQVSSVIVPVLTAWAKGINNIIMLINKFPLDKFVSAVEQNMGGIWKMAMPALAQPTSLAGFNVASGAKNINTTLTNHFHIAGSVPKDIAQAVMEKINETINKTGYQSNKSSI